MLMHHHSNAVIIVSAFSIPFSANNKVSAVGNSGRNIGNLMASATSSRSFSDYIFAQNGVCVSPKYFVLPTSNDDKSLSSPRYFTMRNVPGDGDCMFLAVALATLASMGLGANDVLLRAISREKRDLVATILESSSDGNLIIEGQRYVSASALLKSAAAAEKISPTEYIRLLRLEGRDGGLYGGGPELTVLCNVLRRPISIYHVVQTPSNPIVSNNENNNSEGAVTSMSMNGNNTNIYPLTDEKRENLRDDDIQNIKCMGIFGAKTFPDPLLDVPNSAILSSNLQTFGAYSWHLHILVVDASATEKHACVLLPQDLNKQQPI